MRTTTLRIPANSLAVFLTASFVVHALLLCIPLASQDVVKSPPQANRLIAVELMMPEHDSEKIKTKPPALLQPKPKEVPPKKNEPNQVTAAKEPPRAKTGEATVSLDRLSEADEQYRTYLGHLRSKIGPVWDRHSAASEKGLSGIVTVRFTIASNGSLQALTIKKNSSHTLLDEDAKRIIRTAAPFMPFPDELSLEKLHVLTSFVYEFNSQ